MLKLIYNLPSKCLFMRYLVPAFLCYILIISSSCRAHKYALEAQKLECRQVLANTQNIIAIAENPASFHDNSIMDSIKILPKIIAENIHPKVKIIRHLPGPQVSIQEDITVSGPVLKNVFQKPNKFLL